MPMTDVQGIAILVSAIAGYLAIECGRCGGMGEVVKGYGSDRTVDGVKIAGEVFRGPCPACGSIREALKDIAGG